MQRTTMHNKAFDESIENETFFDEDNIGGVPSDMIDRCPNCGTILKGAKVCSLCEQKQ